MFEEVDHLRGNIGCAHVAIRALEEGTETNITCSKYTKLCSEQTLLIHRRNTCSCRTSFKEAPALILIGQSRGSGTSPIAP